MRTFKKSSKLNHVGYDIRGPVMDEADRMAAEGIEILKLNTGNPAPFGLFAPENLLTEMTRNLQNAEGYSASQGIYEAREGIVKYCRQKGIEDISVNDIYTGNGVSELIMISMQALLDEGDEILIPMPDYPLWTAAATLSGGTVVHYLCDEEAEWYPDIQDIKRKITNKTKGIVIINPNNPTGALYPRELLLEIAEVARQHQLILFSDEIYDRLVFDDGEHISIASLAPDLFTITFNGLSKSHMVAGYRCGFMCLSGNRESAKEYIEGIHMLASMRLCSNVLSQHIIAKGLEDYDNARPLLQPGGRLYQQRELITEAINQIPGLSAIKPKAAFYLFPKIDIKRFGIIDDEKFVLDFLHEYHILMTHGGGFHWHQPDHFRIVYLPDESQLQRVADSLKVFLNTYKGTAY